MTEQLISRKEAAAILGVSTRTINRYAAAGSLRPTYVSVRGQLVPRYWKVDVEKIRHRRTAPELPAPESVCH